MLGGARLFFFILLIYTDIKAQIQGDLISRCLNTSVHMIGINLFNYIRKIVLHLMISLTSVILCYNNVHL